MLLLIAASGRLYSHRLSQRVLRIGSQSVPFRGSAIVPTISFFLSRALKGYLPPYIRGHCTSRPFWHAPPSAIY